MKKIFLFIFVLISIFSSVNFAQAAIDKINGAEILDIKKGGAISAFSESFTIKDSQDALKRDSNIVFRSLTPGHDSVLNLPAEYTPISPVYEYILVDRGALAAKKNINVEVKYESDLRFNKFVFVFNEKKSQWAQVESLTDVDRKVVKFSLSKPYATIVVADTHFMEYGKASWYRYKKCMCAASPDYPKGTQLLVINQNKNNESILVKVNDWGPERDIFPERVIDLDVVAFEKLLTRRAGVLNNIRVIPFHKGEIDQEKEKQLLEGDVVALSDDEIDLIRTGRVVEEKPVEVVEEIVQEVAPATKYYFLR